MLKEKPEYFQVKEVMKLDLSGGRYSVFLMKKRNYNTLSAIRAISRKLGINEKKIGYAGNKDKKAITEQYISILDIDKRRVENLGLNDIELKYVGNIDKRIRLGGLEGNKFKIKIDGKIKKVNFLENYFGEQRFGRENWKIGKKIIKGEKIESTDKKELKFYFHAYQSFLWNEALRRILRKYDHFEKDGYVFLKKNIKNFKLALVNFDTELDELYKQVLDEEGIKKEDFLVRRMPFLVSDTVFRDAIVNVKDFKLVDNWIEFFLPKGAYATVYLSKILL